MGAGAAPLKILIAMRRIGRLNCQSSRELVSTEHCPCELLEGRTRLEWRQQLVGFGYKHYRLKHLSFSIYSENTEISLNSPGLSFCQPTLYKRGGSRQTVGILGCLIDKNWDLENLKKFQGFLIRFKNIHILLSNWDKTVKVWSVSVRFCAYQLF